MQQNHENVIHPWLNQNISNRCLIAKLDTVLSTGGYLLPQYGLLPPNIKRICIGRKYNAEINYNTIETVETLQTAVKNLSAE